MNPLTNLILLQRICDQYKQHKKKDYVNNRWFACFT